VTDGLPGPSARFASPLTSAIDRIEVVKGPASVLYGKSQPGGFVNIILKKPEAEASRSITIQSSTYMSRVSSAFEDGRGAVIADFTGPLDDEGRFLYRVIGEYNRSDSYRSGVDGRNTFVMPSLRWNISDATELTLTGEYRDRQEDYDLFLVAPNRSIADLRRIPITTRYQEPGDNQSEEGSAISLAFAHTFESGASFRLNARRVRNHDVTTWFDNTSVVGAAPNQTLLNRTARIGDNRRHNDYFDASVTSMPIDLDMLGEHTLLVGVNGGNDSLDAFRRMFYTENSFRINLYNPVFYAVPTHETLLARGLVGTRQRRLSETDALGFYLTDFVTLSEMWKLTFGVRRDREKQLFRESVPAPLPDVRSKDSGTYPMVGLVFQPSESWSFYGSYSTSFVPPPPNFQDVTGGRSFSPEKGKQFEVGGKAFLLDDTLTATLSVFDIVKDNVLAVVPCNPGIGGTCNAEVGREGSQGIEFEISAQLKPNWSILFGYAYVDVTILRAGAGANIPLVGSREPHALRHAYNLWTRYDFEAGGMENLGIGLGLVGASSRPGNFPSAAAPLILRIPGWLTADVAMFYGLSETMDLAVKLNNVFDKDYYESVGSTLYERAIVPGTPRNISLSLTAKF
jgi:iron complex outermembrane receptor protein